MHQMKGTLRGILIAVLLIAAVLSCTLLGPWLSNAQTYDSIIDTLDDKKTQATEISTLVTVASVAISLIPDDTATPVADELAEFTTPLLAIVAVLHLEKYLLTSFGGAAAYVLLPVSLLFYCIHLFRYSHTAKTWGARLLAFAILVAAFVPLSVWVTNKMEETHALSAQQTFSQISDAYSNFEHTTVDEDANIFAKIFSGIVEGVTDTVTAAKELLSMVIDAVGILIVTSCIIPVITLILFIWLAKGILTGQFSSVKAVAAGMVQTLPRRKPKPRHLPKPEE